jgi:hypothetical protein
VGKVLATWTVRITDLFSSDGPATASDISFGLPATCTATTQTDRGSTCTVQTTANTLLPGAARSGDRANVEFGQIKVLDPGANGTGFGTGCPPTCGDGDEQDFLRQGIFVP